MGKFGKLIDRIITIWIILVDIAFGGIMSAFTIAVMFIDTYYYEKLWSNLGLAIASAIAANAINFMIKIFLRSFKK